jgi:outer membrane receptor protein involved in Fe transport
MRHLAGANTSFRACLLAGIGLSIAVPAAAQSPAAETGDIIVTALKRDTTLQDTPIAISAVTGETLTKSGVRDIGALNAPSLNFVDGGPSSRRVVIRGIQAAGEPTVGVYYDETPVTGALGAGNDAGSNTPELRLFDVERVEVLRGPQGTLYGSGSMGGTLRIIYNKPVFETRMAADVSLSGTEDGGFNYLGNAMVNVPLMQDVMALRVTGFYGRDAGYIDNVALGIDNINKTKVYGGRAQLRIVPTSALKLDLAAFVNRSRTDTPSWALEAGRYKTDNLTRQPRRDDFELYSGTANWDLGGVVATGVLSYAHLRSVAANDVSRYLAGNRSPGACAALVNANTPCGADKLADFYALVDDQVPSALDPDQTVKTLTTELRLSSDGKGPLNWTVGGFYSRRHSLLANRHLHADPVTGELQPGRPLLVLRNVDDLLKQVAAFGELSWDLTDRLNLTAGIRYFKYDKVVSGETPIGNVLVRSAVLPLTTVTSSEDGTTLKFNASYKITRDVMVYAGAAQGFRPGGLNQVIGLDPSLAPYRSDNVWNYELGIKSTLFDRRLTLNADVFQIDWSDIQITGTTPNGAFRFITNAGSARVKGIEAEASLRPVDGLLLEANGSYIDAKLTTDQKTATVSAPGKAGDRIPYVPKLTGSVAAEYRWAVGGDLGAMVRIDLRHVGSSFSDFRPTGTFTRRLGAYELVNARIGLQAGDGRWGAYLFATNLFDKVAVTRSTASALTGGRTFVNTVAPRTIGINLRTDF